MNGIHQAQTPSRSISFGLVRWIRVRMSRPSGPLLPPSAIAMLLTLVALASPVRADDVPLAADRGTSRLLVLVAPKASDPAAVALSKALTRPETWADFANRQIVVFTILGGHGEREGKAIDPAATRFLLDTVSLHPNGPAQFVLVGKDGGVKWRRDQLSIPDLLAAIEQMPMRREEVNRQSARP